MKLTHTIEYINQALNYPAITYEDVSLYFDMAITELNTVLHISMPTTSTMFNEFRQYVSKAVPNRILLKAFPEDTDEVPSYATVEEATSNAADYCYIIKEKKYATWNKKDKAYTFSDNLYAIFANAGNPIYFKTLKYSNTNAIWVQDEDSDIVQFDFNMYLPDDWVILWIIPYICFKYTVRDGGTASVFAEEVTQGFQQLQNSYDIPSKVLLSKVADKPAYYFEVVKNLPYLNKEVPLKAIYPEMKHSRNINASYGSMFDRGGFSYDS